MVKVRSLKKPAFYGSSNRSQAQISNSNSNNTNNNNNYISSSSRNHYNKYYDKDNNGDYISIRRVAFLLLLLLGVSSFYHISSLLRRRDNYDMSLSQLLLLKGEEAQDSFSTALRGFSGGSSSSSNSGKDSGSSEVSIIDTTTSKSNTNTNTADTATITAITTYIDTDTDTDTDTSTASGKGKERLEVVKGVLGGDGGAWTAQTHMSKYGFNVDWGLMDVLESSCRDIENSRIPDADADADDNNNNSGGGGGAGSSSTKWNKYTNSDPNHPLINWWKPPSQKKYINCKVIEIGCGVGVYVDGLKKEVAKQNRIVIGIEPNWMGGTFERGKAGPKQLAINFLDAETETIIDGTNNNNRGTSSSSPAASSATTAVVNTAKKICHDELGPSSSSTSKEENNKFDLLYSIEVFEHIPLERHNDAALFLATLSRKGTKLIFGAGKPGQGGVGHIGNRSKKDWIEIMKTHGFIQAPQDEIASTVQQLQEMNHRLNTVVYYYNGIGKQL